MWLESTTEWVITLWSGEVLSIFADSYSAEGENLVFDVFVPGKPPYFVEIARVPHALIDDLVSEITDRPDAPDKFSPNPRARIGDSISKRPKGLDASWWAAQQARVSATEWVVTLASGEVLSVYADNTSVEGDDRVFTIPAGEDLPYPVEIGRVPLALLRDYASELADRPGAPDRYPPLPRMPLASGLPVQKHPNGPRD